MLNRRINACSADYATIAELIWRYDAFVTSNSHHVTHMPPKFAPWDRVS